MDTRKLVKAGQASHTISLPKQWLSKNNLKKGDVIFIHETPQNELRISTDSKLAPNEQKEIAISVDGKDIGAIQRELTSAYVNNYSTIHLAGKELNQQTKEIRELVHEFVALEVAEQTATKITAKDLLNLQEISLENTLKRMDMIIRSILSDAKQVLQGGEQPETIHYRDSDVNRLYFLLYRLLKYAMTDPTAANRFDISTSQALALWQVTLNLESIADCAQTVSELSGKLNKEQKESLQELYSAVETFYLTSMKSYYTRNKEEAGTLLHNRRELFDQSQQFLKKNLSITTAEISEQMKAMITHSNNIARAVLDDN